MAIVMSMHWPEVNLDQYEQTRREVNWEGDVPNGAVFHLAWMSADGFRAIDLWESPEDFQRFVEGRLNPVVQQIGIQGQPNVSLAPVHAIFNPRVPTARPAAPRRPSSRRATSRRVASKAKSKTAKQKTASRPKPRGKRRAKR